MSKENITFEITEPLLSYLKTIQQETNESYETIITKALVLYHDDVEYKRQLNKLFIEDRKRLEQERNHMIPYSSKGDKEDE